jgi:hypothetical protein
MPGRACRPTRKAAILAIIDNQEQAVKRAKGAGA